MARYFISLEGPGGTLLERDYPTKDEARNGAVILLGQYLQDHPEFAYQKHWRVDLKDSEKRLLLHVMVATVDAPPPINMRSFES